jgi:DNA-binding NarL/FixJ family response regulator
MEYAIFRAITSSVGKSEVYIPRGERLHAHRLGRLERRIGGAAAFFVMPLCISAVGDNSWMSEPAQKTVTILLVDDHALFREGVRRLLGAEPEFEVAGDCESIEGALQVLKERSIDIVLLDFYLGERDGKEFLRLAKEQGFGGKVLLVTVGVPQYEVVDLIRAGVFGIFLKRDSASLLAQVIRYVMAGGLWFNQRQLQSAMNEHTRTSPQTQRNRLTPREQQVLGYVFEGFTNRRIAERIGVSTGSVKATLQQLFSKTGVRTRSQLVRIALEQHRDQL